MNISEIKVDYSKYEGKDLIDVLFECQDELRIAYNVPVCDLDIPSEQQQLRAMAWNVTEEIGEVMEVIMSNDHPEHRLDELSDALSFYIELILMSGLTRKDFEIHRWDAKRDLNKIPIDLSDFIMSLALSINTLKNRYWRQTNVLTDANIYHMRLKKTFPKFIDFVKSTGVGFDELIDGYLRKYEVNKFRINSKY